MPGLSRARPSPLAPKSFTLKMADDSLRGDRSMSTISRSRSGRRADGNALHFDRGQDERADAVQVIVRGAFADVVLVRAVTVGVAPQAGRGAGLVQVDPASPVDRHPVIERVFGNAARNPRPGLR